MALVTVKEGRHHPLRSALAFARRQLRSSRRRTLLATAALLLLLLLAPLTFLVFWAQPRLERMAAMSDTPMVVAPPLHVRVFPFRDLCDALLDNATTTAAGSVTQPPGLEKNRISHLHTMRRRLRHIPADGGAAGARWSAATGLPQPSGRPSRTVAARFVTLSTQIDDVLQASTTAAAMAAVPVDVIGLQWRWFVFARRLELHRSYVRLEKLRDSDVVVSLDSDAFLSGEDVYDFLCAFAASTAETQAEHATYAVRDIRTGKRQPPVLFSAESNCMHAQAFPSRDACPSVYDGMDDMMRRWAQDVNASVPAEHTATNPFRYLNAGVVVARVWALRRLWSAAQAFMATHPFFEGEEWWCDQSVYGSLYAQLRWWEVASGILTTNAAAPLRANNNTQQACPFPPLVLPDGASSGPHGMPAALMGLDTVGRLAVVISARNGTAGSGMVLGGVPLPAPSAPEAALQALLATSQQRTEDAGVVARWQATHRLEMASRPGFDCTGGEGAGGAGVPVECAYRAAVWGLPETAAARVRTPLIWHFAGSQKRAILPRYRAVFPWYTPMLWSGSARQDVLGVLRATPAVRLWFVNESTDRPLEKEPLQLYPHHDSDTVSVEQLCGLSLPKS